MEKKNKIGILIGIILGIIVLGFIIFITLSFIFSNEKELKTMVNGDSTAENDDTTQIINSIKDDTINLKNIYDAIKTTKAVYPDVIKKELVVFKEKFKDELKEENVIVDIDNYLK